MKQTLNTIRMTGAGFLAYFVMAAVISPLGIVSQSLADYFSVSLPAATAVFSTLTTGIFVGSIIAIFIFDFIAIKWVVLLAALMTVVGLVLIYLLDSFVALSFCLFITGTGCGLALSAAAVVITELFNEKIRPSMLLLTDSFYSGGASASSFIAVVLLHQGWHWWSVYLAALVALALLMLLAGLSSYPNNRASQQGSDNNVSSKAWPRWPLSVYICGLALLLYLLGLVTLYSWLPNFAVNSLAMAKEDAGNLVGQLFSGMFFGQLLMFLLVLKLPTQWLVAASLGMAGLLTAALWAAGSDSYLLYSVFATGLIGGGIFKVTVAYGTTLPRQASPKLVSFLLFNTALGTAIAPALSAWIVSISKTIAAMQFATACYFAALLLLLLSFFLQARAVKQPQRDAL